MKKILLVLSLAITSCDTTNNSSSNNYDHDYGFDVIEIEGCQYLIRSGLNGYSYMAHKGNCYNPIHPENK